MSDAPDEPTVSDVPHSRLTQLCAEMSTPLDRPENDDVRAIIFLNDRVNGGIQMVGYDDQVEAMAALFIHMQQVFQSMGKTIDFIGVPESPEGLTQP